MSLALATLTRLQVKSETYSTSDSLQVKSETYSTSDSLHFWNLPGEGLMSSTTVPCPTVASLCPFPSVRFWGSFRRTIWVNSLLSLHIWLVNPESTIQWCCHTWHTDIAWNTVSPTQSLSESMWKSHFFGAVLPLSDCLPPFYFPFRLLWYTRTVTLDVVGLPTPIALGSLLVLPFHIHGFLTFSAVWKFHPLYLQLLV